jgi:glycosyltransferase involved in cell wall biosynthesis
MKIAILSVFYPYRGGIAQFSGSLFRALEAKYDVKAFNFTLQYPSFLFPGETQFVKPEDNADEIPSERLLNSVQPFSYLKTANKINAFDPDIFISNYWMSFFGPSMGFVAKKMKKNTKRIAILHNVIPHEKRFYDSAFNRYFLKQHDAFVVLSSAVEKDLLSLKPDARVLQLQHPIYSHFGEKISREAATELLKLDSIKKTILFFGIIRDYKGLDVLLSAFAMLSDEYQLVIAGECYGTFDKYEAQIQQLGIQDRCHIFNRYIPDHEVATFFSAADVCILPYKSATQSGITAVSHHFCVPLIATNVGGLKETIKEGENGTIVSQPKPELFASAIENYFKKDLQQTFSENIRIKNKDNSWLGFSEKVIAFALEIE